MTATTTTTSRPLDSDRLPVHIAVIMDGNGRWATARGLDRSIGHAEGVKTVRRITEAASQLGVKFLTLYTFSTENWNRPQAEVDALMHLIVVAIERETPDLIKNNVRLRMIGDIDRMPDDARRRLQQCIADTSHCTGLTLVLALSYSSRWDITRAARQLAADAAAGIIDPAQIDDAAISARLSTSFMPDPDLLIRTGGDRRISNFLLWELAYTELYITPVYWPDFTRADFEDAIADFQGRQRRFGLTGQQVEDLSPSVPK